MKLDDTARCQSMTVFNTDTAPNCCVWYNSWGNTHWPVWKYKKRSDTSTLRIMWEGYLGYEFQEGCIRSEIWINDEKCQDPYPIEVGFFHKSQAGGWSRAESGDRFLQSEFDFSNLLTLLPTNVYQ